MQITVEYGGTVYPNITEARALERGVPQGVIDAAMANATAMEDRGDLRRRISIDAGDTLSMLGTTADAAALATLGMAALTVAVSGATSFADFKTAFLAELAKLEGDQDMVAIATAFLGKIESGDVVIPVMAKGIDVAMIDIEARSTAVSEALISAAGE